MKTIDMKIGNKVVSFTTKSVTIDGTEYSYSKMSGIKHSSEKHVYAFKYDGAYKYLPYDPKYTQVLAAIFKQVNALDKKRQAILAATQEIPMPTIGTPADPNAPATSLDIPAKPQANAEAQTAGQEAGAGQKAGDETGEKAQEAGEGAQEAGEEAQEAGGEAQEAGEETGEGQKTGEETVAGEAQETGEGAQEAGEETVAGEAQETGEETGEAQEAGAETGADQENGGETGEGQKTGDETASDTKSEQKTKKKAKLTKSLLIFLAIIVIIGALTAAYFAFFGTSNNPIVGPNSTDSQQYDDIDQLIEDLD